MKLKKKHWLLAIPVLLVLGAVGALPSFSYVHVSGPDGDIVVQKSGFGNNGIRVKTADADIRVNR